MTNGASPARVCPGCTHAALLHTTMAVYCTLTDTCTSPHPLAMCWQVWLSTLNFSVYESRLEEWQGVELALPDATEPGSVSGTEIVCCVWQRACRLLPLFASP